MGDNGGLNYSKMSYQISKQAFLIEPWYLSNLTKSKTRWYFFAQILLQWIGHFRVEHFFWLLGWLIDSRKIMFISPLVYLSKIFPQIFGHPIFSVNFLNQNNSLHCLSSSAIIHLFTSQVRITNIALWFAPTFLQHLL